MLSGNILEWNKGTHNRSETMETSESAMHSYISFNFSVFCDKKRLLQFYTLCQVIKECSEKSSHLNLGQVTS